MVTAISQPPGAVADTSRRQQVVDTEQNAERQKQLQAQDAARRLAQAENAKRAQRVSDNKVDILA